MQACTPTTSPYEVTSGPAGAAGIQGRVGLKHVVDLPAALGAQRAAEGAYDTGGHGVLKAIRIADRHDQLTHSQRRGVHQLGIEQRLFTPVFVIARLSGCGHGSAIWHARWRRFDGSR